jgi:biopolymer transport protein TolR
MGMSLSSGGGGDDEYEGGGGALADINVTPLVDVMLVLLVIFMVTAPLINQAGVEVDLPQAKTGAVKEETENATVTVEKNGTVWLDDRKFTPKEFDEKFRAVIAARKPKAVFLRADQTVPYGTVIKVMDELRAAGITRLGMMTRPIEAGGK